MQKKDVKPKMNNAYNKSYIFVKELAAESDYLALWLDCDREGENIGFEVISLCNEFITYDNVYRNNNHIIRIFLWLIITS